MIILGKFYKSFGKVDTYCSTCGRRKAVYPGTQESDYVCYHEDSIAAGTMQNGRVVEYFSDTLDEKQKANLWLFDKKQQEIKRAWKKDQYANIKGQIRI